jgi:endonuclease YncB( thermonuclease family)
MSKKLDFREYECELIRVVDGDTIDCWIDLGFKTRLKKRVRYMGLDTWESRTRDLEEKKKGLAYDGWVSVNDILMEEGHAYEYDGGKKKVFKG